MSPRCTLAFRFNQTTRPLTFMNAPSIFLTKSTTNLLQFNLCHLAHLFRFQHLQLGSGCKKTLFLVGVKSQVGDITRGFGLDGQEGAVSTTRVHKVAGNRLVGSTRRDTPPCDHFSDLVLVVQATRDSTPKVSILFGEKVHGLKEETEVGKVTADLLSVFFSKRLVQVGVNGVGSVQEDRGIKLFVHVLGRASRLSGLELSSRIH
mmetsp:Transcript_2345/g.3638  ORF Transcript_2345/g.3638 Transcript_2345/m.3638 type:complete len:205 (+) Transcript_2345:75-689(+)